MASTGRRQWEKQRLTFLDFELGGWTQDHVSGPSITWKDCKTLHYPDVHSSFKSCASRTNRNDHYDHSEGSSCNYCNQRNSWCPWQGGPGCHISGPSNALEYIQACCSSSGGMGDRKSQNTEHIVQENTVVSCLAIRLANACVRHRPSIRPKLTDLTDRPLGRSTNQTRKSIARSDRPPDRTARPERLMSRTKYQPTPRRTPTSAFHARPTQSTGPCSDFSEA